MMSAPASAPPPIEIETEHATKTAAKMTRNGVSNGPPVTLNGHTVASTTSTPSISVEPAAAEFPISASIAPSLSSSAASALSAVTETSYSVTSTAVGSSVNASAAVDTVGWGSNFWVTVIEPQSQTPFYACPGTGQVSWDPPVGNFVLPPSAEGEWWELIDESRGIPYYYHNKSNETVWERPEGFIIPLGILQNTALVRRLSTRYSQVIDTAPSPSKSISETRHKRSVATDNLVHKQSSDLSRRLSQSSIRSTSSTASYGATGSKRVTHNFGHPQLPTIPASPDQTEKEDSLPPSPTEEVPSYKGKQKSRAHIDDEKANEKERGRMKRLAVPNHQQSARSRSTSPSYIANRSAHPQSLDAMAEQIAQDTPKRDTTEPDTPVKHTLDDSALLSKAPAQPRPSLSHAPRAGPALKINTEQPNTFPVRRDSLFPSSVAEPRGSANSETPSSNGLLSATISKGRADRLFGNGQSPVGSMRSSPALSPAALEAHSVPSAVIQPRKSFSALRTQDISAPTLNIEAAMNLSPVKVRVEGKPLLVKNDPDQDSRFSTGGRPVLPEDLASDIQQFVHSDFARQYFSTHRTGFIFRRKVPVEKMMAWQKTPLQAPLLELNRELHKDAVKVFKVVQRIMGDRERDRPVMRQQQSESHLHTLASTASLNGSSTSLPTMLTGILEEERWLLTEGLAYGELRDEIYCQVMKQLTGNPNAESLFRGWQLLCVLLVTFPPSKNFETHLRSFINQHTYMTEGRVDIMAKYCIQRLAVISKKGPKGKPPGLTEIEAAADAAFNPSTFGESLDAIIRLQERTYPNLQVPIVLPFLADGILALGGTKSEGIFRVPGDGDTVSELRLRIERGYYNLEGVEDPHVPASLFKLWLRELCDPLVPTELYNDCVACAKDPDACVRMVSRLPTINRRVVLFVVSFLQLFLDEKIQSTTKMTSANLALVMAPNLLRCVSESMTVVFTNAPYEQSFVHNLLLHLKCSKVDPDYVPKHGLGSAANAASIGRNSKSRNRRPTLPLR